MRLKIDWASLIVRSKSDCFCFVLRCLWGQFSKYKPQGGLYLGGGGQFNGEFFALRVSGFIFGVVNGGAYFRNFTVMQYRVRPI